MSWCHPGRPWRVTIRTQILAPKSASALSILCLIPFSPSYSVLGGLAFLHTPPSGFPSSAVPRVSGLGRSSTVTQVTGYWVWMKVNVDTEQQQERPMMTLQENILNTILSIPSYEA